MSNIATPMPQIRARFTSKLGIPLSGCKVYTYEPNSNIPKTTWIDIDKTVENTNPILLDAAGEADIFLDGLYQIVVKDRFGFVVYDVEKTGYEQPIFNDGLLLTWSGRTQADKNHDVVFVEDYGATASTPRLSSKYSTLAQAQSDYPSALTLSDTFDIVAFEKALSNHKVVHAGEKTYFFNRELRIPSYRGLYGQGIRKSFIKMTDDAYLYNNIITNEGNRKQGNNNSTNTANECIFIDGFTLDGNFINVKNNTASTSTNNPLGIQPTSGLGKSGLVFSGVFGSGIKNIEVTQACGHSIDIAARYNAVAGGLVWSDLPSRNINIDNVIISYNEDDAITTHFSENINISNFLIYHSGVFNNSNGIEVDDGSRLVNISNGFIFNQTKGISIKSHDTAPCPYMVNVSNVTAMQCNISFDAECGNYTTVGDDSPSAYGINFVNCISWLPRARVNTTRAPRHLYINAYSGVNVTNLHCYGNKNTTIPRPSLDEFDFGRPYQPVGYGGVPEYNKAVIVGGVDVTYRSIEQSVIVTGNARNVRLVNINIDGEHAKTSHIYIHTEANNVSVDKVSINNCTLSAVGSEAAGLIDIGGDAENVTVSDVTAINAGAEITTYPIVKSLKYIGEAENLKITNIKGRGYKYLVRAGNEYFEKNYDFSSNGIRKSISVADQTTLISDRGASGTGNHIELIYSGGTKRAIFPAITHAAFIGVNNAACRIGSSENETVESAKYWEVGTSSSGADFFPNASNSYNLGKASNLVKTVYAGTGAINTSDERLKQQFRSQSESEKAAAIEIKNSICLFKFNDAVDIKGDGARWHVGVKAQQVISIMESHNLNWQEYGFICFDEWDEKPEEIETWDDEFNEEGDLIRAAGSQVINDYQEGGSRYAVRYDELSMFILAAI
ncbi:hypothetical protein HLH12_09155 [Acinetobacter sp. NIPH 2377]|uniref:tail fiber domain-containing protein n=1 Tax=Acinetobacter terrestris TaxID=2529843 RepID=UPI00148FD145|nr:tail fiber domain-containing protein [Acinetobacter terrestris]NNH35711.1 hypothetical protein [Acinetobacter terrestris]